MRLNVKLTFAATIRTQRRSARSSRPAPSASSAPRPRPAADRPRARLGAADATTTTTTTSTERNDASGSASFPATRAASGHTASACPGGDANGGTPRRGAGDRERTPVLHRRPAEGIPCLRKPPPGRRLRRRIRTPASGANSNNPAFAKFQTCLKQHGVDPTDRQRPQLLRLPDGADRLPQPSPEPGRRRRGPASAAAPPAGGGGQGNGTAFAKFQACLQEPRRQHERDQPVARQDAGRARRLPQAAAGRRRRDAIDDHDDGVKRWLRVESPPGCTGRRHSSS